MQDIATQLQKHYEAPSIHVILYELTRDCDSDVRHSHCVLYNSKELGVLILTVEQSNICLYYYKEDIITTCFGPICGPSSGCD